MPFLTVGGTTIEILHVGARKRQSIPIGDSARAIDGSFGSTVKDEKQVWEMRTGPLTALQENDIREMVKFHTEVAVTGDAIYGGPYQCVVEMTDVEYISDGTVDGYYMLCTLLIQEA